eukprot:2325889-Pyramimonas_sp.AAC.1
MAPSTSEKAALQNSPISSGLQQDRAIEHLALLAGLLRRALALLLGTSARLRRLLLRIRRSRVMRRREGP